MEILLIAWVLSPPNFEAVLRCGGKDGSALIAILG